MRYALFSKAGIAQKAKVLGIILAIALKIKVKALLVAIANGGALFGSYCFCVDLISVAYVFYPQNVVCEIGSKCQRGQ